MTGIGLALACALAWAGLDVFRKQLGGAIAPLPLLFFLNVGLLPVFAVWWLATGGGITDFAAYAPPAGIALVLQVIANLLYLGAVRISPLSLTVPFLALTPAFATGLGALLLHEQPQPLQLLGIALVVGGALALGSAGGGSQTKLWRAFVHERGSWMMIGVAACWALTTVLDKRALAYAVAPLHGLIQLSGVVATGLVYLLITQPRHELAQARQQLGRLVLATATGSASLGLQLLAVQQIFVGQLETIKRAIGLVGAIVFGRLLFGEPITKVKIGAIALMVAGVVLLMLGRPP